jgi:hypothetical protein
VRQLGPRHYNSRALPDRGFFLITIFYITAERIQEMHQPLCRESCPTGLSPTQNSSADWCQAGVPLRSAIDAKFRLIQFAVLDVSL